MEKEEKQKAEQKAAELKERAEQIAAQTTEGNASAVQEFKEEIEREKKFTRSKEKLETLVSADEYLAAGVHIGTARKISSIKKFIYKVRSDGLAILDVGTIDKRIRAAVKFLSHFAPEKIMVVSGRDIGKKPVQRFSELTGVTSVITRFMPGSFTNPAIESYVEPDVVFVVDPSADRQAIHEALRMNIPIISLCNTNNMTQNIDFILPINNRGKKSLALLFWILAREFLKARGKLSSDADFTYSVGEFEAPESKEEKAEQKSTLIATA